MVFNWQPSIHTGSMNGPDTCKLASQSFQAFPRERRQTCASSSMKRSSHVNDVQTTSGTTIKWRTTRVHFEVTSMPTIYKWFIYGICSPTERVSSDRCGGQTVIRRSRQSTSVNQWLPRLEDAELGWTGPRLKPVVASAFRSLYWLRAAANSSVGSAAVVSVLDTGLGLASSGLDLDVCWPCLTSLLCRYHEDWYSTDPIDNRGRYNVSHTRRKTSTRHTTRSVYRNWSCKQCRFTEHQVTGFGGRQ